jgi:hypothetical protein
MGIATEMKVYRPTTFSESFLIRSSNPGLKNVLAPGNCLEHGMRSGPLEEELAAQYHFLEAPVKCRSRSATAGRPTDLVSACHCNLTA